MIKLIVFSALLNTGDINLSAAILTNPIKIEARKRGKGQRERRRGGRGLR